MCMDILSRFRISQDKSIIYWLSATSHFVCSHIFSLIHLASLSCFSQPPQLNLCIEIPVEFLLFQQQDLGFHYRRGIYIIRSLYAVVVWEFHYVGLRSLWMTEWHSYNLFWGSCRCSCPRLWDCYDSYVARAVCWERYDYTIHRCISHASRVPIEIHMRWNFALRCVLMVATLTQELFILLKQVIQLIDRANPVLT